MPALAPVPQVVRFTYRFTLGGDTNLINRFFQKYGAVGPLASVDATSWCNTAFAAWTTNLAPSMSSQLVLTSVSLVDLSSSTGAVASVAGSQPGGQTGIAEGAGVAMVIKELIARRYRGGHPRQYLGGLPQAFRSTPQTWVSTLITSMVTNYTAFRAAVALGAPTALRPATDVSVSYYSGFTNVTFPSGRIRPVPTRRGTPLVDPIASFAVNPKVGSQRRRNLQSL